MANVVRVERHPRRRLAFMTGEQEPINGVEIVFEPVMRADKWGAAGSAADGVRSNEALGADCRAPVPPGFASQHLPIWIPPPRYCRKFEPRKTGLCREA